MCVCVFGFFVICKIENDMLRNGNSGLKNGGLSRGTYQIKAILHNGSAPPPPEGGGGGGEILVAVLIIGPIVSMYTYM